MARNFERFEFEQENLATLLEQKLQTPGTSIFFRYRGNGSGETTHGSIKSVKAGFKLTIRDLYKEFFGQTFEERMVVPTIPNMNEILEKWTADMLFMHTGEPRTLDSVRSSQGKLPAYVVVSSPTDAVNGTG